MLLDDISSFFNNWINGGKFSNTPAQSNISQVSIRSFRVSKDNYCSVNILTCVFSSFVKRLTKQITLFTD